jgi:hypothetical protein
MRKRKSPILLITCLVLFGAVAFAFQYAATASQNPPKPDQATPPVQVGDTRPATTAQSVASQVKSQGLPAEHGSPERRDMMMMGKGRPGRGQPSIIMPKMTPQKPKPNDSAPSTQWYQSGSAAKSGN